MNQQRLYRQIRFAAFIASFALSALADDSSSSEVPNEHSLDNVLLALSAVSGEKIKLSGNVDPDDSFIAADFNGDVRATLDEILHDYSYYVDHENGEFLVHVIGPAAQAGEAYEAPNASAYELDDATKVATFSGPDGELEILPAEPLDHSAYQYEAFSGPDGELEVFLRE